MTEHSKIPLPPLDEGHDEQDKGKSLLERATGLFGLDNLRSTPVPYDLAPVPTQLRKRRKQFTRNGKSSVSRTKREPEAETPPVAAPVVKSRPPVEPLRFTGASQPIDRKQLKEQGMIVPGGEVTRLLEEFRIVKRQLLQSAARAPADQTTASPRLVLVTSPLPGEGKSFCSTNLALALAAERDSEVLLVDADFAKPSVLSRLGLTGKQGLMDVLANPSVKLEDCIVGTDVPGLWILPAGNRTNSDSEFLSSMRTADVLARLTEGAPNRIVIFDSPPTLAATPAAELAKHVGQVVVVVRADTTGQTALEDALQLLSSCDDIKLLLNDAHFSPSGRRFGDYYGYGG